MVLPDRQSSKPKIALIPNDFSQDLEKVFQLCVAENVHYVELAYMWHKSILELTPAEVTKVHDLMKTYNLRAASIQTQIMKVHPPGSKWAKRNGKMHDDFEYNISQIDRAIELAQEFDAPYIVTYSFMDHDEGDHAFQEKNWALMISVYQEFEKKLRAAKKSVVIECDGGQYMGTVDEHLRLMKNFEGPEVRVNFDVANLHGAQGEFTQADFERLYPYVPYFHVKDRKKIRKLFGKRVTVGAVFDTGDIPWRKILPWFAEKGFHGYFSVEPHVHGKNRFEKGRQCVQNLQRTLRELNIEYE